MALTDADYRRLKAEFPLYAKNCLKVRPKEVLAADGSTKLAGLRPLILNRAQQYIHAKLEAQRQATGWVRALILKGRQQGASTYVGGRFYWRTSHQKGARAFILSHKLDSTDALFEMVERYHLNCPKDLRPHTGASNAKELNFDRLDSGYRLGTASGKAAGRSTTVQFFHGSEVAFWPNAQENLSSALEAVPGAPGTEVILESTADGIGNVWHKQWQAAEARQGDYIPIFVPWFWTPEYASPVPAGFALDSDETEYQAAYQLALEQMAWRRAKIVTLGSSTMFSREYPATAVDAFTTSSDDVYIIPALVLAARKTTTKPFGPKVLGVDPARFGDDRSCIALRQGRVVPWIEAHNGLDTVQVAARVDRLIKEHQPARVFVDVVGLGAGVVDQLRHLGHADIVTAVNGGERPMDPEKYVNRRSEIWGTMRDWLMDKPADLPDDDELHGDLIGPRYYYDANHRTGLEPKPSMKKRGLRSPDMGDALANTFAHPVQEAYPDWMFQPKQYPDS